MISFTLMFTNNKISMFFFTTFLPGFCAYVIVKLAYANNLFQIKNRRKTK